MKTAIFFMQDIKSLKIKELAEAVKIYTKNRNPEKAQQAKDTLKDFRHFCTYATDEMILKEVNDRLTDYYQTMAGYYYMVAEDFPDNPFIKIDRLKRCIFYCNKLKEARPEAEIYANKYICRINRNYLR